MRLIVHRGSQEVGGTCIEIKHDGESIILDIGMPLFDSNRLPLGIRHNDRQKIEDQQILPCVPGLFDPLFPSPLAIILSHAHLDHTGLLNHTKMDIPVIATEGTSKMMLAGSLFASQVELSRKRHIRIRLNESIQCGPFKIRAFEVDHSIHGSMATIVEAGDTRLLYSGDLRLHGNGSCLRPLLEYVRSNPVDILLMEGTHIGFDDGDLRRELDIGDEIHRITCEAKGLVIASLSPQHTQRLLSCVDAAASCGRTFVADAYTAFLLYLIHQQVGILSPAKNPALRVYVPKILKRSWKWNRLRRYVSQFDLNAIDLSEILQAPKNFLMLFRGSMMEDFGNSLPSGTTCIYSQYKGYLETDDWKVIQQELENNEGRLCQVHTSGHIHSKDISEFVDLIKPKVVCPVHTFEPRRFCEQIGNAVPLLDKVEYEIGEFLQPSSKLKL